MNNKDCNGGCKHCHNDINPIQTDFREKLASLLTDVMNKITPEMNNLNEINIADDLITEAAILYAECEAPMSEAVYHLIKTHEEVEEELISEEISEQQVEINPTGSPTDSNLN